MVHQRIKPNVWVLDDLGFLFFHNGNGYLKLNKTWYISSFSDEKISMEILERFPEFFEHGDDIEGNGNYEHRKIEFTLAPKL